MKNQRLKKLSKIEFVVTDACTGKCKHCSEGDHALCGAQLDARLAADAVRKIAALYDVQTVMAFGGEPLLCPDTVCAIMTAAKELNVSRRQVITNGYFSKSAETVREIARRLAACGVNDLLLSVDAFHQEHIPPDAVKAFARELIACDIPTRLSPAWLVSETHDNPYNRETREILRHFTAMGLPVGVGNVVFPEGNARKFLAAYFTDECPVNPYVENPRDVRCVSFAANGDVLGGNVYREDVMQILRNYSCEEC